MKLALYARLWVMMALAFMGMIAHAQIPATLTDLGTNGLANLPEGLNYYTDNQSNHSGGEPGQPFTTPGGTPGFLLNSVTIKTGGGTSSGTGTAQHYVLQATTIFPIGRPSAPTMR